MQVIFEEEREIEVEPFEVIEDMLMFLQEIKSIDEINDLLYKNHYNLWIKLNNLLTVEIRQENMWNYVKSNKNRTIRTKVWYN